ncbi:MAG: hypothetical protein ABI383_05395 [Acidobacteriaceae bacterium]
MVAAIVAATQAPPAQFTIAPQGQEDPGSKLARSVMDRTIQALGGEAYMNIHDVYQQGQSGGYTRQGATDGTVPFWRWFEFPDKERAELLKTHEWVIVYNGDKAWDITYHGTKPLAADDLKQYLDRRSHSVDAVLRGWVRDPRTIYFSNGELFAAAKQCYSVTLINGSNQSVTLLLDKQTYLPVKKSWSERDQFKEKFTEEEIFDQYRDVQGFQTAFVTSRLRDGHMTGQRYLSRVVYNFRVPPEIFTTEFKKSAPIP